MSLERPRKKKKPPDNPLSLERGLGFISIQGINPETAGLD